MFTTGGYTQPVECPATQKALGGPIGVANGVTSEAEIMAPRDEPWRLLLNPSSRAWSV